MFDDVGETNVELAETLVFGLLGLGHVDVEGVQMQPELKNSLCYLHGNREV